MKNLIFLMICLPFNISYADECTDIVNLYLESLRGIIEASNNKKEIKIAADKIEGISFQRLTKEDCGIRSKILGVNDLDYDENETLNDIFEFEKE